MMDRLRFTKHSVTRMQQRGISRRMVDIALAWGSRRTSHSALCYSLTDRSLKDTPYADEIDRLRGLSVVVSSDNHVITCKWDYRLKRKGMMRRSTWRSQLFDSAAGVEWQGELN